MEVSTVTRTVRLSSLSRASLTVSLALVPLRLSTSVVPPCPGARLSCLVTRPCLSLLLYLLVQLWLFPDLLTGAPPLLSKSYLKSRRSMKISNHQLASTSTPLALARRAASGELRTSPLVTGALTLLALTPSPMVKPLSRLAGTPFGKTLA